MSLSDPWNLLPGTLATFPEGARGQAWLGLFTLYLDHAASGHPALSQSFYSPFVLTVMGVGDLEWRPVLVEGLQILAVIHPSTLP